MKDTAFNVLKYRVSLFYSNKWIWLIYMNEDCVKMLFIYAESRCLIDIVHVKTSIKSCNDLLKKNKLGNAVNFETMTHCLRAQITWYLQMLQSLAILAATFAHMEHNVGLCVHVKGNQLQHFRNPAVSTPDKVCTCQVSSTLVNYCIAYNYYFRASSK